MAMCTSKNSTVQDFEELIWEWLRIRKNCVWVKGCGDQENFVSAQTNLGTEFIITVPTIAQSGKVNWGNALNLQPGAYEVFNSGFYYYYR